MQETTDDCYLHHLKRLWSAYRATEPAATVCIVHAGSLDFCYASVPWFMPLCHRDLPKATQYGIIT